MKRIGTERSFKIDINFDLFWCRDGSGQTIEYTYGLPPATEPGKGRPLVRACPCGSKGIGGGLP